MSRLPQHTVDAVTPELRMLSRLNELEARLAEKERGIEADRLIGASGQPGFLNGWTNYDANRTARFYKLNGEVQLAGMIRSGTMTAAAFLLPEGYRHGLGSTVYFPVASNAAFGSVVIDNDGYVKPHTGSNVWVDLASIRFRARA